MHFKNTCKCQLYIRHVSCKWTTSVLIKSRYFAGKILFQQSGFGTHPCRRGPLQSLSKSYSPPDVEHGLHEFWQRQKECLHKEYAHQKPSDCFSMILPPPNVTGNLHLGHTLTVTIQDILARWNRMQGKKVLWIPGFDHAGIATQTAFEKKLWKERRWTRYDLGRQEFEKELWNWKKERHSTMMNQLTSLGASLDWSHEYFTLDAKLSEAVTHAYIKLYLNGLIYRSKHIVNWCCELQSAISDIEVEHVEINGPTMLDLPNYEGPVEFGVLVNFSYSSVDGGKELIVSTTRIETMLGDTAVAVHPSDERYTQWHGSHLWHPFLNKSIPVVCDDSVDPHFGTGAVKITPAHSLTDYNVGRKHDLEFLSVIDEAGIMNDNCGKFKGLKRFEAREKIKNELAKLGLFHGQKDHAMSVPVCSRTGDVIEYLLKPQWFLSCQEMAKDAVAAVESGKLSITPSSYNNVWFNWLNNIRDWCISRQLWWGHRIPAYECSLIESDKKIWVAAENIEKAKDIAIQKLNLQSRDRQKIIISQDVDVLDTWFSSALLPFSALGWPNQTKDFKDFYPLSVMETGHDILFFWVARMVMLGTYLTGKLPFQKIILHGIICDSYGRKMSKSLGNVIDPQDVIKGSSAENLLRNAQSSFDFGLISSAELNRTLKSNKIMFPNGIPECGSDALRFTLCSYNISNVHINFDVDLCQKNRQFCNKMWQACRYIQESYKHVFKENMALESASSSKFDKWIISRLAHLVLHVNESLNSEAFHIAADALRSFIQSELCSIYLEGSKPIVRACDSSSVRTLETLILCMDVALRILNPFMPFITEHLYQHLPLRRTTAFKESITFASYPSPHEWMSSRDEDLELEINDVLDVVTALRHLQSTYEITKKDDRHGYIECSSENNLNRYREHINLICTLSGVQKVEATNCVPSDMKKDAVHIAFHGNDSIYLKASKRKDVSKEFHEKVRRYKLVLKDLQKLQKITSHPGYKAAAPEKVQLKHKERMSTLEAEIKELEKFQEFSEAKNR